MKQNMTIKEFQIALNSAKRNDALWTALRGLTAVKNPKEIKPAGGFLGWNGWFLR